MVFDSIKLLQQFPFIASIIKFPNLKGTNEGDFYAMCTSEQAVKDYLYNGVKALFENTPDLAGYFSITMSENLTNCYSRVAAGTKVCPKCKE